MELSIQKFLRFPGETPKKFEDLKKICIRTKRHSRFSNLVLFKYAKSDDTDWSGTMVRECRGLILDEGNNWKIVSHPFHKFFNHGDKNAASLDLKNLFFHEKLDGSLLVLFPYRSEWLVATLIAPDGLNPVSEMSFSFARLFWRSFNDNRLKLPFDMRYCFFFELTSRFNRSVIEHKAPKLTLLGARDLHSGQEVSAEYALRFFPVNIPTVQSFQFSSLDEAISSSRTLDPTKIAGYIAVDRYFNRQKLMAPGYIALFYAKGCIAKKHILDIVRAGDQAEILSVFPELSSVVKDIQYRYRILIDEVDDHYQSIMNIEDQKVFASEAKKSRCSGALFALRKKNFDNAKSFMQRMRLENLACTLKLTE